MVLSGLQNGGPAVALLVHAEIQVISEEVLVFLNCLGKQGCLCGHGGSGLLPVLTWRPRSWGIRCEGTILTAVRAERLAQKKAWEQE